MFSRNFGSVSGVESDMDTDAPGFSSRPSKVAATPASGTVAVNSADPFSAAFQVPVVRVPVAQRLEKPLQESAAPLAPEATTAPTAKPATALDVAALPDDPAVLKQMIIELLRALRTERHDRQSLEHRLDALLRRLQGSRSGPDNPDQPSLFADLINDIPPSPPSLPPEVEQPSRRGKCKPHGRRQPSPHLRRQEKRYQLTAAERLCPECGQERQSIGIETTEQYDYMPAEVFVVEHQQVKYACKYCEGHVVMAPKPSQPIDKGLPGPGLLAVIATDKYLDHLPLHRTEQRMERLGVDLPRSTMCDWMASGAELLTPLYEALKRQVLQSKVLHTDDTTAPVRDERLRKHRYGRLWDYIGDKAHPGVVFDYTTSHARDGPATFLKDFQGYLQADAYGVYDGIYIGSNGKIIEVGCWAHARNKFADAQPTDPERVLAAKAWVRKLYDVEEEAKTLSSAERLKLRQEKSVPLLQSFHKWLLAQKVQVLPKSPTAKAINYVLNQWEALNRYTTDGDLHIDNNLSERTLKLIGIGRLNWLFIGSDKGGRTAAVYYSFTATCKLLDIDSFAYLRDIFERLPSHPPERLEELLPHNWQAAGVAAAAASGDAKPS
jgi:transposase